MTTDETYPLEQAALAELFERAGWVQEEVVPDETRVQRITERAIVESIANQSTCFIFLSFQHVISNFMGAFCGKVPPAHDDYRP